MNEVHTLRVLSNGWCHDTVQDRHRIPSLDLMISKGLAEIKDEFIEVWGGRAWNVRAVGLTAKGEAHVPIEKSGRRRYR